MRVGQKKEAQTLFTDFPWIKNSPLNNIIRPYFAPKFAPILARRLSCFLLVGFTGKVVPVRAPPGANSMASRHPPFLY
jgi:hypothetical protein